MSRHSATTETAGWVLLILAILALLWLFMTEQGNAMLTGVVTVKTGGTSVNLQSVPVTAQNPRTFPLVSGPCPSGYSMAIDKNGDNQCVRNDYLDTFMNSNLIVN